MWSIYEKPDGSQARVWYIVNPSENPHGIDANAGVIVEEIRDDPEAPGQTYQAEYVMDDVPQGWVLVGELPPDVAPPNEPVPGVRTGMEDLWALDLGTVVALANRLGVTVPEGKKWLKKDYVHAVHEARLTQQVKFQIRGDGKINFVPLGEEEEPEDDNLAGAEGEVGADAGDSDALAAEGDGGAEGEEADAPGEDEAVEATVEELKAKAKDLGITGYSSMRKAELIEAIAEAEESS